MSETGHNKSDKEFWEEQYDLAGNMAYTWWSEADNLLTSAKYLRMHCAQLQLSSKDYMKLMRTEFNPDSTKVIGVMKMLWGMATECYLKGLWVEYGGELAKNGSLKKIPNTNNHDLVSIAKAVASRIDHFDISNEEEFLLRRLSLRGLCRTPMVRGFGS
jgi:hypothetical protein